jgi:alkaline phosphatase
MRFLQRLLLLALVCGGSSLLAQNKYTVANLHSHNDYEKPFPFTEAWKNGYGSIEADIFLVRGKLIVAHDTNQVKWGRTLDSLYLVPLDKIIRENYGFPYGDHSKKLQLLIDIKRDSVQAMRALVKKLAAYPSLTRCRNLQVVITGNRPPVTTYSAYPSFIWFDGELYRDYPASALSRIVMMSDDFKTYSAWKGEGIIPPADKERLDSICNKARSLHKKIRFWNAPDNPNSWDFFMKLGVDYINTDKTTPAAVYIQHLPTSGASY